MTKLDEILENKRREIERAKRAVPLEELKEMIQSRAGTEGMAGAMAVATAGATAIPTASAGVLAGASAVLDDPASPGRFSRALRAKAPYALIGEIKRASPSKGVIISGVDPGAWASLYERSGAAAVSVLTDTRFFHGSLDDLREAKAACSIPVLRKDFIVDPYQVYETAAAGADAFLLILAAVGGSGAVRLLALGRELGLEALVEIHTIAELEDLLRHEAEVPKQADMAPARAEVVGINNRDLGSFTTSLAVTCEIAPRVPKGRIIVSESGIFSREDAATVRRAGAHALLVGEALMRSPEPGLKIGELIS
ncbi:MAG: indole-3-glycerol-phosphate synthase [Firmicutes bacterium]|nr:indole-3-glycerol-phosphate synthase [Bacillota bacterium]